MSGGVLVLVAIGLALLAGSGVALTVAPDPILGLRWVIKGTAWSSGLLFLLVFIAAPTARLWPGALSNGLVAGRRWLGLSFALSHLIHGLALIALVRQDPALFWSLTNPGNVVTGGIGYGFIALMAATSFSAAQAWRCWPLLHRLGLWYLWLGFCVGFGKRLPQGLHYAAPVTLLLLALGLRLLAWRTKNQVK